MLVIRMYFNAYILVVYTISTVRWSDGDKLPVYFNTYVLVTHIYFNTYVLIMYRISTVRAGATAISRLIIIFVILHIY